MVGHIVVAQPQDQTRPVGQYVVVREWPNVMELVPAEAGPQAWRPIRVELDGPQPWVILGRCRSEPVIRDVLKYLTEGFKHAKAEWTAATLSSFKATADLLLQCLMVGEGLAGCEIIAQEPYGHGSGDFIVLAETERCLYVVPTDLYGLGKTRHIPIVTKDAWHILEVNPGITVLSRLISGLRAIDGTDAQRQELTTYLNRWVG